MKSQQTLLPRNICDSEKNEHLKKCASQDTYYVSDGKDGEEGMQRNETALGTSKDNPVPKQYWKIRTKLEDSHFQTSKLTSKQW